VIGLILGIAALIIWWRFDRDIKLASARVAHGSALIATRCGPIEYQDAGTGVPLLAVHGSGGGYDQGMAFAGTLVHRGIRVIAMSRFGYLRTPMPADASAAAQADAHVCLLDALGIRQAAVMGGSAGAPSALQMAIRHPDRVSALVLLVPLAYKPPTLADSAPPLPPWVENTMMRLIGSDFLFWSALHGGGAPSPLALQILTVSYTALTLPLLLLTRKREGAARAWSIMALAVFAVSALHLSHADAVQGPWLIELVGHHASIALIFAILYQDFRFALADLFLKRALALFALVSIASGLYFGVEVPLFSRHDYRRDPVAVGTTVILWVGLAVLYPLLRTSASRVVDRFVLRRRAVG